MDSLIWEVREDGDDGGEAAVKRDALAAILPFAEAGLAHSDIEAVAGLQAAVNCLRAVLSNDGGDDGPAGSLAPV